MAYVPTPIFFYWFANFIGFTGLTCHRNSCGSGTKWESVRSHIGFTVNPIATPHKVIKIGVTKKSGWGGMDSILAAKKQTNKRTNGQMQTSTNRWIQFHCSKKRTYMKGNSQMLGSDPCINSLKKLFSCCYPEVLPLTNGFNCPLKLE